MGPRHEQAGCLGSLDFGRLFRKQHKDTATLVHGGMKEEGKMRAGMTSGQKYNGLSDFHIGEDWVFSSEGPPAYSPSNKDEPIPIPDPTVIKTIESKLDELNSELRDISLKLHSHPELGFGEKYAHDIMTDFMEKHGFKVTRHYARLDTAWRAEYKVGHGGRVLGVNSEMDALPGIGHACGHNLIAICGLGIAVAVKTALEKHQISGKVVALGTPAEEEGGGKILLLDRHAYDDMDVCLMAHPSAGVLNSSSSGSSNAAQHIYVQYTGKTAHAAAAPWEGKNALDAAVVAYTAISALRQQIKPDLRVHGLIEGSNWTANTIPDNAKLTYIVRAPSKAGLTELAERVLGCFKGAALSTGCTVKIETDPAYYELRQNSVLAGDYANTVITRYEMTTNELNTTASTDFGNVTYELPSFHPMYAIPTVPGGGNHTPGFTRAARTQEAHDATMKVAKGLAITGLRVLSDHHFFEQVKAAFEADKQASEGLQNTTDIFVHH